ncbi:CBS domain-containing protein [Nordella sp. HKS 07]|uniref:CBS domain-containing protein n=1 Tax=Nordella sp. HKS 07 TaxID=2712222 RepID=UPI0013E114E4|nr:CBS domain-containing protein [Nordella sp. HKS 07]QIG48932.1 CBS domain-containing protein [Nordella sp. HKS 07]
MRIRDLESSQVTTIGPEASVRQAAKIMLKHGISGLPVVDDDMKIVGIITEGDLIRRSELGYDKIQDFGQSGEGVADPRDYVRRHSWKVGDVMTRDVVVVEEDGSIAKAARLLEKHNVKRLPVVRDGKLVGMISRCDLLRVIATSVPEQIAAGDEAIRRSIKTRLHEILGSRDAHVDIAVVDGGVRLSGQVATADERDVVQVIAENTRGVRCIENHLKLTSERQ